MRRLLALALLAPLTACGGWGYHAQPVDGDGKKAEHPKCFAVEQWRTPWWGLHEYTYQQGVFCKARVDAPHR